MRTNKRLKRAVQLTLNIMNSEKLLNEEDGCIFLYFLSCVLFEKVLKTEGTKIVLSEMLKDNIDLDSMDKYTKSEYTS